MPCFQQRQLYRKPGGGVTLTANDGAALMGTHFNLKVNCGHCLGCRIQKTAGWAIRSVHEAQMHPKRFDQKTQQWVGGNSFLTLTYRDEITIDKRGQPIGLPNDRGLRIQHWKNFAKKVRNHCGPFRYLHIGEYSPAPEFRPHYHALIFGHDWASERTELKQEPWKSPLFVAPVLTLLWPHGIHSIGELNYKSAAYVAGYALKKLTGKYAERENERVDQDTGEWWEVPPEYATMSRRPGLGSTWFDKYMNDVYPSDECVVDGKELRPPTYYDDLLKRKDPQLHAKVELKRQQHVTQNFQNHTDKQLNIREEIAQAKLQLRQNRK